MRAPTICALGLLSGWGTGARALPAGARVAAQGRSVLPLAWPVRGGDRQRRATRECLLALAAVDAMLEDARFPRQVIAGERTALLYATAAGYAASNRDFIEGAGGGIHFAYTAPVVPAEVAIEFGVTGPYAIFLGGPPATLRAIWQAALLLDAGECDRALVLAVETFEECADLYNRSLRLTKRPLVEAAACLCLEPGRGRLSLESRRSGRREHDDPGRRFGEMLSCEPLAAIDLWRRGPTAGTLELFGRWRGERARLVWTDALPVGGEVVAAARAETRPTGPVEERGDEGGEMARLGRFPA